MKVVVNTSNVLNGFDNYGHYLRTQLQITNCVEFVVEPSHRLRGQLGRQPQRRGAERRRHRSRRRRPSTARTCRSEGDFDHEGESDFGADEKGKGSKKKVEAPKADDAAAAQGTADLLEFLTGDGQ